MNRKTLLILFILVLISVFITIASNDTEIQTTIEQPSPKTQRLIKIHIAFNAISTVIPNALERYASENRLYPTPQQGLDALVSRPTTEPIPPQWERPYIKPEFLLDPWQNLYAYTKSDELIEIRSFGPDSQKNTEDDLVIEFPVKNYNDIALNDEEIYNLTEKIVATISPKFETSSLELQEDGQFLLEGRTLQYQAGGSANVYTLATVLRTSSLFNNIDLSESSPASSDYTEFTLSGNFVGNLDNEQQITSSLARIQELLDSQCMKFEGFKNPNNSKCDFNPQNLTHQFNRNGTTVTFEWECPNSSGAARFYWFCCSCKDNTSNGAIVEGEKYTLPIDPNHEYAYSVACFDQSSNLQCSSPLESIKFNPKAHAS